MNPILKSFTWTDWPGRIFHCPTLPSTNTLLMEELRAGSKKFKSYDLVWTEYQNAGRGRRGKKWMAPNSKQGQVLTFSVLISFAKTDEHFFKNSAITHIPQVAQIAAWTWATLLGEAGVPVTLKWPNDILFEGKKLAGFLSETLMIGENIHLVLGMGINLVFTPSFLKSLEKETGRQVVSLRQCLPSNKSDQKNDLLDPKTALNRFLKKFHPLLELWRVEGFAPFVESWKNLSDLIGQKVTLINHREKLGVWVEDIGKDGRLIVKDQGERRIIDFGEIDY